MAGVKRGWHPRVTEDSGLAAEDPDKTSGGAAGQWKQGGHRSNRKDVLRSGSLTTCPPGIPTLLPDEPSGALLTRALRHVLWHAMQHEARHARVPLARLLRLDSPVEQRRRIRLPPPTLQNTPMAGFMPVLQDHSRRTKHGPPPEHTDGRLHASPPRSWNRSKRR